MKKLFFLKLPRGVSLFWIPVFALFWLIQGCGCQQKEAMPTYRACGNVVEFGTNKTIPNAEVTFSNYEGDPLGGSTITPIATINADTDGHFCHDGKISIISANATGFYPSGDDFIFVGQREFDDYKVALYPKTWIRITIRNESGAYLFSGPGNELAGKQYILNRDEEITFITNLKGNRAYRIIYDVYPVQNGMTDKNIDAAKMTFNDIKLSPSQVNSFSTWVEIIPTGHDTADLQIIY